MKHPQTDVVTAMEDNMASHLAYLPRHLSTGTVRDAGGILLVDSGLPSDTFNAVCRARLRGPGVDETIRRAIGYFRRKGLPFTWWVGPTSLPPDLGERLIAHGLSFGEAEMGMRLELADLTVNEPLPPGLEIRRVRTPQELHDYARVAAANWDPPDMSVIEVFRSCAPAVLGAASPGRFYLAYLEHAPVATSECFMANGVAGIYGVTTLPAAQRRGIGTAVTAAALRDARSCGYTTAVLQASVSGQRIYARLGFTPCAEFHEYH